MKKIHIIVLAILAMTLVGCQDYLNRTPLDKNSDATNWTNEASLSSFANMFYNTFDSYGSGWSRGQYLSSGLSDDYCPDEYSYPTQTVPSSSSSWSSPYSWIRRANILLSRVDKVPNLSDEAANHWRGVARFFRAAEHYNLVCTYGDVVWIDTEVDIDDSTTLQRPRDPRLTVMKNVCADLQFAAENIPYSTDNTLNNMCAYALLSRAALHEAAWQKYHENNAENAKYFYNIAKKAADAVISSGHYTIHTNYQSNYISKDLTGNTEMILFKVYCHTGEGAKVTESHSMQGWCNSSSKTWGLTKSAVESFDNSDGLPIFMGQYSDATIENVFKNRDARLSFIASPTVLCPVGWAYTQGVNSSTGYWTNKFVDLKDYGTITWSAPSNTSDGPIYTYSEVMENYAEACAELEDLGAGAMSQADLDKSINIVRAKHGNLPALTYAGTGAVSVGGKTITKDPKNTFGVSNLLWEIRRERRSELMCDGFREEDIMRWKMGSVIDFASNPECYEGASKAALTAFYEATKDEALHSKDAFSNVLSGNFWSKDGLYMAAFNLSKNMRVFSDKNYLEPIPSAQITLNSHLTQNPGW